MKKLYFFLMMIITVLSLTAVISATGISIEANDTVTIESNDGYIYYVPSF